MPVEQSYTGARKRSKRSGSVKEETILDRGTRKELKTENPIITWVKKEWAVIIGLILIFVISLFLRAYFYFPVATENGFLLSGNDPFYHKRVIDYAQEYFTHIKHDPLLDYPLIGVNPRPPVYDWSNAVAGLFLSPAFGGDVVSTTWLVFLFSPAFWGALTIFPVYFLTRDMFGRKPAIIAAFFMGIMASHIERSPLGFSDHDAMVVFFVVTTILFLAKAIGNLNHRYWVKNWKDPAEITIGIKEFFIENPVSLAFSIMAGLSIATIALVWKGFPYVLVIILGSFLVLTIINHLRKFDSMGIFFCMYIAFIVGMALSLPWYAMFNIGTWIQPLYMLMAFIILAIAFIPTRDMPWIVVIPLFLGIMAATITVLQQIQPETVDALFTGGGYFIKSKLYSTIAEAQAPDTSRLAISYGPVTFYLSLIGLVVAAIQIPKNWNMDFFLIIVWCFLAIYMALSAVRFMFNATPVFAILGGWITWNIVERLDPTLRAFKKFETRFVYLYIGILTLMVMSLAYWYVYLEHENFLFYQILLGVGLFGVFIAIFTTWLMLKYNFMVGILIYVAYIVFWIWYTFDALINQTFGSGSIVWEDFPLELFLFSLGILLAVFVPMILFIVFRQSVSGAKLDLRHVSIALFFVFLVLTPNIMFAIDASIPYETKSEYDPQGQTFGAFGHSFPSDYWQAGMDWLSEQDTEYLIEERPAFISWWDYGFWCLYLGEHPTVADNFQAGYQLAGSFIASKNETQAISLFVVRILEGDFRQAPRNEFSPEIESILLKYLDNGDLILHPNYDRIVELYSIEQADESEQKTLIKEVEDHPNKYGNFDDLKIRNAKYAAVRQMLESKGKPTVVDLLTELDAETNNCIRYFAVDTRLFPFTARNTGIFYAPIKLADRDIADYIKYYADVEVRDNRESDWRSYSDRPVPTEELEDEIDLNDIVETHGSQNVRIKDYQIKYTDDFYNSMFYKCYSGYTYDDLFPESPTNAMQEVPAIYGQLAEKSPMQGWNMNHFRLVYRTAYWTPHNQTELGELDDSEKAWQAMSEIEAIKRIQTLESDGKDNDNNGQKDDRGEGGTWSPSYRGGGVFFLKYYHGAIVHGKVVTDSESAIPVAGVRVTVFDEFGIPHHSVVSDEEGNYNLTVPFGDIFITTSKDGYPDTFEDSFDMRVRQTEQTTLNTSTFQISDQQAMRKTNNWIIEEDLKVPVAKVSGRLYWEKTNDENYNPGEDKPITEEEVRLFLDDTVLKNNLSYTTTELGEEGEFEMNDVVPGSFKLSAVINGHYIELPTNVEVSAGDSGEVSDVEQDFPIKQGIIKGNLSYTNNTNLMPDNITIKLYDQLNDSVITKIIYNNISYLFDELMPGNYTVYVDTLGIKYFKDNFTLAEGERREADLPLIPLVPVSGTVYNDIIGDGIDDSDLVMNAHIEFINLDNSSLSNVIKTNLSGQFSGNITKGNYTIYIHYTKGSYDYVHLSSLLVEENTPLDLILNLEDGFWINGTITKQVDSPVVPAAINFIIDSDHDQDNTVKLPVPTNSDGLYRTFLPYRHYKILIEHVSSGNITYLYYNSTSFLEEDVSELARLTSELNNRQSASRQNTINPKITKDIFVYEASRLWGYVYWDHNNDGRFYPDNQSYEDSLTEEPQVEQIPGSGAGSGAVTRTRTRSRTNGDDNFGSNLNSDTKTEYSYFPNDFSGPEKELVTGVTFAFHHETQTIYETTNHNGYYSVFLPPGNSTIEVVDPRFKSLTNTNPADNLKVFMPFNRSYQVFGIPRNFSVEPIKNTIKGTAWFDFNADFEYDENQTIPGAPLKFDLLNPNIKAEDNSTFNVTVTTDSESGEFSAALIPGEYFLDVDWEMNEIVKYTHSSFISVPLYNPDRPVIENIPMNKYVYTNLSITTEDFGLNASDLANVTLKLFMPSGIQVEPMPLELNNTNYKGYLRPMEYTIRLEFSAPSGRGVLTGTKYIYFGKINLSELNNQFAFTLLRATALTFSGFVDSDQSGNYTHFEERPPVFNFTLKGETGGVLLIQYENGTFSSHMMPGISYNIKVNDTRTQQATHGFRWVRYITDYTFEITGNETGEVYLDIPMIKYINLSGKVYYDENENTRGDANELRPNVPIQFTGPMNFTIFSNSSGRFSKFVLPDEYFVTIDEPGFQDRPKINSYNVTLDDTFFDIEIIPIKVRVYGFTYFDANNDIDYDGDSTSNIYSDQREFKLGGVTIRFARNILIESTTGADLPSTEPLEEHADEVSSKPGTGDYEIYLAPGEYNVNAFVTTGAGITYCALDLHIIGRTAENDYNISMYLGRLVEGNVFYRDSDLNEIRDLDSRETGNGLKFENLETGGSKIVLYRYKGTIDKLHLPFGNYSVTTEFLTEEYGLSMDYSLTDTVWIQPDVNWYTFEMNKENDYSIEFNVIGDSEVELRTADRHEEAFMITVENTGNTYNVVDLLVEDAPAGWYVQLSNYTLPLDIAGKYSKINITLDITIPVEAYAVNKITLKGEPRGEPTSGSSVTLTVNTPASYDFKVDYEEDLDRGIDFNETLLFDVNVTKLGNAKDSVFFKFYNVQPTWNVSLMEAWVDDSGIVYQQDIDSFKLNLPQEQEHRMVTIQVRSPERINASMDEISNILINTWSENRPEIEYTEQLDVQIRKPDIILKDIKFKNQDLKESTNVTIIGLAEVADMHVNEINFSLYVNNVWVENKTVMDLAEDSQQRVEFFWQVERYNLTDQRGKEFKFKIEVNSDQTLDETDYQNNIVTTDQFIGEEKPDEPFNWRPIYAMLTLLIIFVVIWGFTRWRRKI